MTRFLEITRNLIFPPRCAGCQTLLSPTQTKKKAVFCTECEKQWHTELCLQCPTCFAAYPDCRCQSKSLERAGSKGLLKLAPYGDAARERVMRHIVLRLKKHPRRRVLSLLAAELTPLLSAELDKLGWSKENVVIVHLPRDTRSVRRYGEDQAKAIALALSREVGIAHQPLLYRRKHAKQQKSLNAKERAENLRAVFVARQVPKECHVILVDDVVTTGASLCAAALALREAGVKELLCVALAQTPKKR